MGVGTQNLVENSFLQWLHNQREHERINNYNYYSNYYNGDHEVEVPEKIKAALQSELGTVLNYCRIVVDNPVDYIAGGKITVEVPTSVEAELFLNDIYDENGLLNEEMMKLLTVMGKKGDVFLKLFIENNEIKINVLRPDICFPRYETDNYMKMIYCAVQWWEDPDEFEIDSVGIWHAQVFRPDRVDEYISTGELDQGEWSSQRTNWELVSSEENLLRFIPIIHIKNTIDDLEFGVSDLQVMTDLQDLLNKTMTDMGLTMDQQAFQRIWVFGSQSPKGVELTAAPGFITEVPEPTGHIDVIQPGQIQPFIAAVDMIVDHIMTVTSMGKASIMKPDAPLPPSGFALRMNYIPMEAKAGKKVAVLQSGFRKLDRMIFEANRLLGRTDYGKPKTKLHFSHGLPVDETSKMQVDQGKIQMGVKSPWTIMEEDGIEDVPAEMARIDEHRAKLRQEEIELQIEVAEATAKFQAAARPKTSA